MGFAKWVFAGAAIYGFIVLTPLYFLEGALARISGPVTYPEYYCGAGRLADKLRQRPRQ